MRLTWKDAAATIGTAAAATVYLLFLSGTDWPIIDSVRGATTTILVLGMVTGCAMARADMFNGAWTPVKRVFAVVSITLGVVAVLAAAMALIVDAELWLTIFTIATVALWATATARHLFTDAEEPVRERDLHEVIR